ncbi:MAG: polyprenol monophosphomannose synthase [Chloroflexi bacterium]|nr:polyprenol monophosphomannose synthase [Chloroflexota bacterium]
MKITLILPTYNEAENLPRLVAALFSTGVTDLKLLVVDDLSPDGTGQIAQDLAAEYPGRIEVMHRDGPRGLGRAYIAGFKHVLAGGDAEIIGQMDADFSHPPERLPDLIKKLEASDLALGSRYIPGGGVDIQWPIWRKALSLWGNFYARTILNLPIRDVTGAYRLWRRDLLASIPYENVISNGYVFLVEILHLANKKGARFGEVPIYFADRKWGHSKMNLGVQIEAAWRVWQVKWRYRK